MLEVAEKEKFLKHRKMHIFNLARPLHSLPLPPPFSFSFLET